ncbi:hypothetical protein GGR51DRAFT_506071 [Nemania sp. FL0031]|nr:hypothetical protein GGR51DRAFT_506071 [Nemania sp. FL0031]
MSVLAPSPRGLLSLPVELHKSVLTFALQNSDHDFLNLTWSCRSLYYVVSKYPTFFFRLVGTEAKHIPMAVAHYHAAMAPWKYPRDLDTPAPRDENSRKGYLQEVTKFCDKYLSKQGTQLLIPREEMTARMIVHARDIQCVIDRIAMQIAPSILQIREEHQAKRSKRCPPASPTEIARISKCLYIIDLVGFLFPKSPVGFEQVAGLDEGRRDHAFDKFWSCFAPWESVQVEALLTSIAESIADDVFKASKLNEYQIGCLKRTREAGKRVSILIMWKGLKRLKELAPLFSGRGISEGGRVVLMHMRLDNWFHVIRYVPWQNTRQWFVKDGFPLTAGPYDILLHRKVLEAYDTDSDDVAARVWLWGILNWCSGGNAGWHVLHGFPMFSAYAQLPELGNEVSLSFWDLARIKSQVNASGPPPLVAMIEAIGNTPITIFDDMYSSPFVGVGFIS